MVTIKNKQRKIFVNINTILQDIEILLELLKYQDFDIGLLLTTNKTMRAYNREYRHIDKPTDILSFPYRPKLQAGKRITIHSQEDRNLGDLIISLEYVQKEAEQLNVTLAHRLRVLIVHGICHLLGYDHIEDYDYRRMRAKEAWLLKQLTIRSPSLRPRLH
jgi:probable rRNA maturation factor